jgi:hypothetical protein
MRHGKHLLSFLIGAVSEILVVRTSAVQEIRGYSQPVPSTAFLRQQFEPKKQDKGPTGSITTRLSTPEPTLTPACLPGDGKIPAQRYYLWDPILVYGAPASARRNVLNGSIWTSISTTTIRLIKIGSKMSNTQPVVAGAHPETYRRK